MTSAAASMPRPEAAALLGVPVDASPAEVQHAFVRAARRTHPDVVPQEDDTARRAAGEAFARLTRARDVLLSTPPEPLHRPVPAPSPAAARVPRRGLGGSLVLLALLAFLLIAIVSAEQGLRTGPYDVPATTSPVSSTP